MIQHNGKRKYRTQPCENGGFTPKWNQVLEIVIGSLSDELKFSCYDKDLLYDDYIGHKTFNADYFYQNLQPTKESIQFFSKGKKTADIWIESKYTPHRIRNSVLEPTLALNANR